MTSPRGGAPSRPNLRDQSTGSFPIVISGPSGVGKSSVIARVLDREPRVRLSVSVTTRRLRRGEVDKREYVFLSLEEFERQRSAGDLVEWAEVHGNFYGTPRQPLERLLAEGYEVLLDIDYQGGIKIRQSYREAVLIFVLPPSWRELEVRLRGRRSDPEPEVRRRLDHAIEELAQVACYDYFVVNSDIDRAAEQVTAILAAERQRVARLSGGLPSLMSGVPQPVHAADPAPRAAPKAAPKAAPALSKGPRT